jgi:hypothetical protein
MWTKKFWLDVLERSVKAAGWSVAGTLGAGATGTLTGVDWPGVLNVAGFVFVAAALGALLVGGRVGAENSASWLPEKSDPPAPRRKRGDSGSLLVTLLVIILVVFLLAAILGLR